MPPSSNSYDDRLLSASRVDRRPAPDHVWDYGQHTTWHGEVWKLIEEFADEPVRHAFLKSAPTYVVSDDLSWLDDIVLRVHGRVVDSKGEMADQLRVRYRAIRAYHGTAVNSFDSFYTMGLQPLVIEDFQNQARELFLCDDYPELSESNLVAAIDEVGAQTREGRVYFEANEQLLINHCGHYLLYGSEYLVALAANLGGRRDYRQVLKGRRTPTLFVCDVPLDLLRQHTLMEFAGTALAAVFQELLDGPDYAPDQGRGAGFSIHTSLEPADIVGHFHPIIRRDPLSGAS